MNSQSTTATESNALRLETVATRLNSSEMRAVEAAAEAGGITRSEWLRDAALSHLHQPDPMPCPSLDTILLAEIMGLRLLVLNLFPAAIPGFALESLRQIIAYADAAKHTAASNIVCRLSGNQVPK
jgi:hypothetical protein